MKEELDFINRAYKTDKQPIRVAFTEEEYKLTLAQLVDKTNQLQILNEQIAILQQKVQQLTKEASGLSTNAMLCSKKVLMDLYYVRDGKEIKVYLKDGTLLRTETAAVHFIQESLFNHKKP